MLDKKTKFKKDRYTKNRGDYSRWLIVLCENCKSPILGYQKDGPGILKRIYLDRITAPEKSLDLDKKNIKDVSPLMCRKCKKTLGIATIWKKEKRPVYRLFVGAVEKKIVSLDALMKTHF